MQLGACGITLVLCLTACARPSSRGWECIAPAAPGGGWDLSCRTAARAFGELGLSPGLMRTTNMPGAGGGIAFAHTVGQRRGDGSLLVAASPATTLRLAQNQFGSLKETDVRWVAALGTEYGILAVHRDAPWRDLGALLRDWARSPRSIAAGGGSAVAGQDHMKILLLANRAGIDPRHVRYVPFDGGGEALTALLGGFIQVFSGEASEVEGNVEAGLLRVLAVLAPERLGGSLAQVPTATEAGYPVEWVTWRGFYAPAGITAADHARWIDVFARVAASDSWARIRAENRLQPFFVAGPEFESFVKRQVGELREVSRRIGLIE